MPGLRLHESKTCARRHRRLTAMANATSSTTDGSKSAARAQMEERRRNRNRGHPLGLASTGKKAFVPNSSSNQVDSLPPRVGFYSTNSNLSFRLLIPDRFRCATSHNEAIRSVTHLVLAHKLPGSLSVPSLSLFFILKASGSLPFLVFLAI